MHGRKSARSRLLRANIGGLPHESIFREAEVAASAAKPSALV